MIEENVWEGHDQKDIANVNTPQSGMIHNRALISFENDRGSKLEKMSVIIGYTSYRSKIYLRWGWVLDLRKLRGNT